MKASELRIGNLVNVKGHNENPFTVYEFSTVLATVNGGPVFKAEIKTELIPIPLTEERLVKFGFSKTKNPNKTDSRIFLLNGFEIIESNGTFSFIKPNVNILYVHQLQNLHFALTGTELTIK